MLRRLKARSNLLWVFMGDFNDLLAQSEKRGGQRHPECLIHGFRDAVNYGGLREVEMSSYQFTWERSVLKRSSIGS